MTIELETTADTEKRIRALAEHTTYPVACICGSMRFYDWMLKVAERYTLKGYLVLLPLVRKDAAMTDSDKHYQHLVEQSLPDGVNLHIFLDAMHRAKIDQSDEIIVCTNGGGYFGDSTRAEIAYAAEKGKSIHFERDPSGPQPGDGSDDWK
jgi:hypothetical protein